MIRESFDVEIGKAIRGEGDFPPAEHSSVRGVAEAIILLAKEIRQINEEISRIDGVLDEEFSGKLEIEKKRSRGIYE